jgi:hypothetical protein
MKPISMLNPIHKRGKAEISQIPLCRVQSRDIFHVYLILYSTNLPHTTIGR